jgi:vancomycin resistance protein YoaR
VRRPTLRGLLACAPLLIAACQPVAPGALTPTEPPIAIATPTPAPAFDLEAAEREQRIAVQQRVAQLLARPIVLTFEDQSVPLTREDLEPLLSVRGATLGIDAQAADALARLLAAELHRPAVNARFGVDGTVLRESTTGWDLDITLTAQRLTSALINGQSKAALPIQEVKPAVATEDGDLIGSELIDRGSTSFAGSVLEKKLNIKVAAERLNGVVVPPHGTFSFNDEVGPTTLESGYEWGFAIEGGAQGPKTVPSVAGGICQVATTLFQPVFWAGYPLVERYAHGYWIPGYTSRGVIGLDVTVDGDAGLDFQWSNPTDDYVLIQSSVTGDTVQFALYGKKPRWTVDVAPAVVTNPRPTDPAPVREEDAHLPAGQSLQVSAARDGFDVQVTRTVTPLDGGEQRALRVNTSYQPSRAVTLVGTG